MKQIKFIFSSYVMAEYDKFRKFQMFQKFINISFIGNQLHMFRIPEYHFCQFCIIIQKHIIPILHKPDFSLFSVFFKPFQKTLVKHPCLLSILYKILPFIPDKMLRRNLHPGIFPGNYRNFPAGYRISVYHFHDIQIPGILSDFFCPFQFFCNKCICRIHLMQQTGMIVQCCIFSKRVTVIIMLFYRQTVFSVNFYHSYITAFFLKAALQFPECLF